MLLKGPPHCPFSPHSIRLSPPPAVHSRLGSSSLDSSQICPMSIPVSRPFICCIHAPLAVPAFQGCVGKPPELAGLFLIQRSLWKSIAHTSSPRCSATYRRLIHHTQDGYIDLMVTAGRWKQAPREVISGQILPTEKLPHPHIICMTLHVVVGLVYLATEPFHHEMLLFPCCCWWW